MKKKHKSKENFHGTGPEKRDKKKVTVKKDRAFKPLSSSI